MSRLLAFACLRSLCVFVEALTESKVKSFIDVGGQKVLFTSDELAVCKSASRLEEHFKELSAETGDSVKLGSGIQLLYITNASNISHELNLEPAYYLFPDESSVRGSTTLYKALAQQLAAKGLVAMVRYVRSASSQPRLAALFPYVRSGTPPAATDDDALDSSYTFLEGLYLVTLPFAEDVRFYPHPTPATISEIATEEVVAAAEALVTAMPLKADWALYKSPAMQQFYRYYFYTICVMLTYYVKRVCV